MAKLFVQAQATSNRSEYVFVQDSASTTGGGKTGITFNASSFTAYYVRPPVAGVGGTAVSITLATQTVSGAYSSGGWVEVDATNLPGIYRFDIPNAVFATGVDHAVVMLKGASGMAPVSLEYQLVGFDSSTAWLTSAQTAAAVWDALTSSYANTGTMGAKVLKTTVENRPVNVGTTQHIDANIHAVVNSAPAATSLKGALLHDGTGYLDADVVRISTSAAAADELEGALLHNGTDYISSNLLTPGSVWDEQRTGHAVSGSFGEKLQTNTLADEMLARDIGSGTNSGALQERTVRSALRALRNKVNVGSSQMVVKKEDDTTDAWTASVTTTAISSNVSGIDPD